MILATQSQELFITKVLEVVHHDIIAKWHKAQE